MILPGIPNVPDKVFLDGVNLFLNNKPYINNYELGTEDYALLSNGYSWAKEKGINKDNAIEIMNSIRDWSTLDEEY